MERRWSRHLDLADRAVLKLAGGDSSVSGYLHRAFAHFPSISRFTAPAEKARTNDLLWAGAPVCSSINDQTVHPAPARDQ